MSEYDINSQNNPPSQRTTLNDVAGSVPPAPAYPGHSITATTAAGPGLLRTKISLGGRKPAVVLPFLLMKPELPAPSPITGGMNLLTYYGLDHAWNKFCAPNRKMKEELSAFLPHLPGNIDMSGQQDNSSLRSLIDKPPITGKEILPLSTSALGGFKLQSGPIPENYRVFAGAYVPSRGEGPVEKSSRHSKKKHKRKHERSSRGSEDTGLHPEAAGAHARSSSSTVVGSGLAFDGGASISGSMTLASEDVRKPKTEDGVVSEKKKKKKKDKKRKRSRSTERSSEAHGSGFQSSNPPSASAYATPDFTF